MNISSRENFLSSFGMNLSEDLMTQVLENCEVGDLVTIKPHEFRAYGRKKEVLIDLTHMKKICLEMPKGSAEKMVSSKVLDRLAKINYQDKIGFQLTPKTKKIIKFLERSTLNDITANEEAMRHLIGRGIGLTPSGDDFLMGFTMVLMSIDMGKLWTRQLQGAVDNRTTDISIAYYRALLDFTVSSPYMDLLEGIFSSDDMLLDESIERIKGYGHTSGYDSLYGIYTGIIRGRIY